MPVSADDLQQEVLFELAGAFPPAPAQDSATILLMLAVEKRIPFLWEMWSGKAYPGLQFQYVRRSGIDLLLGQLRMKRDGLLGRTLRLENSQIIKNLQEMRKAAQAEIEYLEKKARAGQKPSVGPVIQEAPVMTGDVTVTWTTANGITTATYTKAYASPNQNNPMYTGSASRA